FTPGVGKTMIRQPEDGTHAKSQTPGAQDPTTALGGDTTLTLRLHGTDSVRIRPGRATARGG
ncbi:MAG TPA: hypothetical protein VN107_12120, partial [Microbacterium sp.]|nr:hypothetical protein [Microbacterium sp.]